MLFSVYEVLQLPIGPLLLIIYLFIFIHVSTGLFSCSDHFTLILWPPVALSLMPFRLFDVRPPSLPPSEPHHHVTEGGDLLAPCLSPPPPLFPLHFPLHMCAFLSWTVSPLNSHRTGLIHTLKRKLQRFFSCLKFKNLFDIFVRIYLSIYSFTCLHLLYSKQSHTRFWKDWNISFLNYKTRNWGSVWHVKLLKTFSDTKQAVLNLWRSVVEYWYKY